MDVRKERLLKLVFPDGVSDSLRDNPELNAYLLKLGSLKVDELKREKTRLSEETKSIIEQTQELAISNYKTFIHTAENSRSIFQEFQSAEQYVDSLIEKLPKFNTKSEYFLSQSAEINEQRRLNSITLKKNAQLLEILEMPQLMERCIREGRYEEALELATYVQKLGENHGRISVISSIVSAVEALWHTMLVQLVSQLRTDLQLPKCLQIVGYLRRMQAFGDNELKLKFLQARDTWLQASLKQISKEDPQHHISKTIEITRVNLFNIMTQYRAIFPAELSEFDVNNEDLPNLSSNGDRLFQAYLHRKIDEFLKVLQDDLDRGINSFDTVLGQCMYFGLSFSRVGADFRALMVPIFVRVIRDKFFMAITKINEKFESDLEKYTLINKTALHSRSKSEVQLKEQETYSPPETLLDFHPLATLCNGYLTALNDLRLCAPIALVKDLTEHFQHSLNFVARHILSFYRQEQQAFTGNEREIFVKFCSSFAYDLVPFIQKCIHALFPEESLTAHIGIGSSALKDLQISYLNDDQILEPLKHLLPVRTESPPKHVKEENVPESTPSPIGAQN